MAESEIAKKLLADAEADMRRLGMDPTLPEEWRRYAVILFRDLRLLVGAPSFENDEVIQINKASHARLKKVADPAARLIATLKQIDAQYLAIDHPNQRDALQFAILALSHMDDLLVGFGISQFGGLPTPLQLVLADLQNVLEGRLGRLVSPPDSVIDSGHRVPDSPDDRMRLSIRGFAAAAAKRLIESGKYNNQQAYDAVANALNKAGFRPPGGKADTTTKATTVRSWHERTMGADCPFAREYQHALDASEGADPEAIPQLLGTLVRSLMFDR